MDDQKKGPKGKDIGPELETITKEREALKIPNEPQLLAVNSTAEKIAVTLEKQGERLAFFTAEAAEFVAMAGGRYSKGGPNFEILLQGYSGDFLRVDRNSRDSVRLDAPAITAGMLGQPEAFRQLLEMPGSRALGLIARFFVVYPKSLIGSRLINPPPVPQECEAAYENTLRTMLQWPLPETPSELQLSADARTLLQDFEAMLEPRLGDAGDLANVRDFAAKLPGKVARVAGLLHLAESAEVGKSPGKVIEGQLAERAIKLGACLLDEFRGAISDVGQEAATIKENRIIDWVVRSDKAYFTRGEAYRALRNSGFPEPAALDEPLTELIRRRYLAPIVPDPSSRGSHPGAPIKDAFASNPRLVPFEISQTGERCVDKVDKVSCLNLAKMGVL